jgi:hypothetical protein
MHISHSRLISMLRTSHKDFLGDEMELSGWWFATVFVIAVLGCLAVVLIVSYRARSKQDG